MVSNNALNLVTSLFDGDILYIPGDAEAEQLAGWRNRLNAPSKDRKKTLIIFEQTAGDELSKENEQFLEKVLSAVGLKMENIVLLNINSLSGTGYALISRQFAFDKLIIAGVKPSRLNMNIEMPLYRAIDLQGKSLLLTDGLDLLKQDVAKKRQLWDALQLMFKENK